LADSQRWMQSLNVSTFEELRTLNASTIVMGEGTIWQPSWDGKVLSRDPREDWEQGNINVNALMIGMDTADGLAGWPSLIFGDLAKDMSAQEAQATMAIAIPDVSWSRIIQQYPASRFGDRYDVLMIVAYRDRALYCPMNRMAQWATRQGIPVYQYLFGSNWTGGTLSVPAKKVNLPASYMPHALELTQFFGNHKSSLRSWGYEFQMLANAIYSRLLTTSVQNFLGSFTTHASPKDPVSAAEWLFVTKDSVMPEYMYFSAPLPLFMGRPGPLLSAATAEDCTFWGQHPWHW